MTLMLYTIPVCFNVPLAAKHKLEYRFNLTPCPLEDYLSLEFAILNHPVKGFWRKLISTKAYYGFQANEGAIYIHPENYMRMQRRHLRRMTRGILSDQQHLLN